MPAPTVRVLEVGGTHVSAASVDTETWQVRGRTRTALDSTAAAAPILASLASAARSLADTVPTPWAVAMPDPFDYERGVALFRDVGKFDALYGVDLRRALARVITPQPSSITFVHDAEAFLLGEWTCGAAAGAQRCVALTLGSGVGSAFLAHGRHVHDAPGLPPAGRIHRLRIDGAPLEEVVSRRAIRARYAAATGDHTADVHEIAERARTGDKHASVLLAETFRALGRAVAPCLDSFAPEVVVVGGSMSHSWDLIADPLAVGLQECGVIGVEARPAAHPLDAPLIGAARQVLFSRAGSQG